MHSQANETLLIYIFITFETNTTSSMQTQNKSTVVRLQPMEASNDKKFPPYCQLNCNAK